MTIDRSEGSPRTLVVFSHPNHELAIFGTLGRVRPHLLYLTDGGGEDRVAQTRAGLRTLGLLERARFLNHLEEDLYRALLDNDSAFYAGLRDQIAESMAEVEPDEIWCDAVEFYNPVHDVSLPLVRAALPESRSIRVFEVPLVHQRENGGEAYLVQRFASPRASERRVWLEASELQAKCSARDETYTLLRDQLGTTLTNIPDDDLAVEMIGEAQDALPTPGEGAVLRYEWRGELLRERGIVDEVITYSGHYQSFLAGLGLG